MPPETVTSSRVKSLTASLKVKLRVALWPASKAFLSLLTTKLGAWVSMVKVAPVWTTGVAPSTETVSTGV